MTDRPAPIAYVVSCIATPEVVARARELGIAHRVVLCAGPDCDDAVVLTEAGEGDARALGGEPVALCALCGLRTVVARPRTPVLIGAQSKALDEWLDGGQL
jgi:hypothetical protein